MNRPYQSPCHFHPAKTNRWENTLERWEDVGLHKALYNDSQMLMKRGNCSACSRTMRRRLCVQHKHLPRRCLHITHNTLHRQTPIPMLQWWYKSKYTSDSMFDWSAVGAYDACMNRGFVQISQLWISGSTKKSHALFPIATKSVLGYFIQYFFSLHISHKKNAKRSIGAKLKYLDAHAGVVKGLLKSQG